MTTMVQQELQSQVAHFCRLLDHLGLIEPKILYQLSQLEVVSALSPKEIERERVLAERSKGLTYYEVKMRLRSIACAIDNWSDGPGLARLLLYSSTVIGGKGHGRTDTGSDERVRPNRAVSPLC